MNISVLITSYNQKEYLAEAIESVLNQTLQPFQMIVVDDCSTDGSQQIIDGFQSRYPDLVVPIYHPKNTGIAQARIDALRAASGDYATYVDGDDRLLPTKLEKEANVLRQNPEAQISFSNFHYIDGDGTRIGIWAEREKPPTGNVFRQTFARDFPKRSLFRCELVDCEAWKSIGFHDPKLALYEDYDMRIRLAKTLQVVYCDEALSEYRLHGKGLHRRERAQHLHALRYIYQKNKPLLEDLGEADRDYVNHRFKEWAAQIAWGAVIETFADNRPLQAAGLLMAAARYDPALLLRRSFARTLTPEGIRQRVASLRRLASKVSRKV